MSYNAIIFDLDGTLLNTLEDLADSTNRVLQSQGFPPHPVDAYRYFVGNGARKLIERVLPDKQCNEETIVRCLELFREDYGQNWNVKTKIYEGVSEMLHTLQDRRLKLSILSNKPHEFTVHCVESLLPDWHFDFVFGQREQIPPKPDPAGALDILERLGISQAECLYVGDTATDMQTAVTANLYPVGVLWGFREREELVEAGAKVLLEHPKELITLLEV
ncbi:HAD family hydrolase [candidate division KSB3 bacterium]|uniref:HAD family hydrolase n=1 Tax=candidate division KSB3 bacterium TaxID=2044937 RepID=A0A2G6K7B9_9BACT|nr:MAG: HAD family hydrolase [candidate division KSB3 bacterium]